MLRKQTSQLGWIVKAKLICAHLICQFILIAVERIFLIAELVLEEDSPSTHVAHVDWAFPIEVPSHIIVNNWFIHNWVCGNRTSILNGILA